MKLKPYDKCLMEFKVLEAGLKRRRELEKGFREANGNVLFDLAKRHADIAVFHDHLKSLVLRGHFITAQQLIRKYLMLKHKGLLG